MKLNYVTFTALIFSSLLGCKKEKMSVPADVAVFVKHHGLLIPAAMVYVKHNAAEFPGTDISLYDDSALCGATGHATGHAHFENLAAGDYYFYAKGYDSTIVDDVMGGIGLHINESEEKQELDLDIPVTE